MQTLICNPERTGTGFSPCVAFCRWGQRTDHKIYYEAATTCELARHYAQDLTRPPSTARKPFRALLQQHHGDCSCKNHTIGEYSSCGRSLSSPAAYSRRHYLIPAGPRIHRTSILRVLAGFYRASESLGAAACGHAASRGPAPAAGLNVLEMCKNARESHPLSVSSQWRRAQPRKGLRGLSNPGS